MNDLSVKIVESSKSLAGDVEVAPAVEEPENDVDPLAIKDTQAQTKQLVSSSEPDAGVANDKTEVKLVENVKSCDDNAKEKIEIESEVKVNEDLSEQPDRIHDEHLIEQSISLTNTVEDNEKATDSQNETVVHMEVTESEPDKAAPLEEITKKAEITEKPLKEPQISEVIEEITEVLDATIENTQILTESVESIEENTAAIIQPKVEIAGTKNCVTQVINEEPSPVEEVVIAKEPEIALLKEKDLKASEKKLEIAELNLEIIESKIKIAQAKLDNAEKQVIAEINPICKEIKKEVPEEIIQKESPCLEEVKTADVEMSEIVEAPKIEKKADPKVDTARPDLQQVNGDVTKEEQSNKRRASEETESESPLKRLCQEVEKAFPQHDTMINEYIQTTTKNSVDEIQRHTEQLLSEIQTLRELAQKKEHEWNNILHLKKVKEEILLRLLRRKQVLSFEKSAEVNGANGKDPFDYLNSSKNLAIDKSDEISGLALKPPTTTMSQPIQHPIQPPVMPVTTHFNPMAGLPPPYDKAAHMSMPKVYPQTLMMPGPTMPFPREMNGQLTNYGMPMGRQGPIKDVKSIIADYRQRNPDVTPRRGRRMKSILNPNMMNPPRQIAPKVDNLNNLGMIFNNLDLSQKAMLERLSQMQGSSLPNGMSFKDVLVQFANIQQQASGLIPSRPDMMPHRPDPHPPRPDNRRRPERTERPTQHEEVHVSVKNERVASSSPRLPPPPPYPEISLLPVNSNNQEGQVSQQNSLLHGILTKQASPASQSYSPTLAKLLTSPERKQKQPTLPTFGQAKSCGEITITPVQPAQPQESTSEKTEDVVQLDDEESPQSEGSTEETEAPRLVIDEASARGGGVSVGGGVGAGGGGGGGGGEGGDEAPLCQGCRRRDAQFVCAGCANQWYCSRDCQVAAWDEHSEMCSG